MQVPIISHRGQKKPWTSIPRINWQHPLTKGLVLYAYDTGGGLIIDLVAGMVGGKSSAFGATPSPQGQGLRYTSGGPFITFPNSANVVRIFPTGLYSLATAWNLTALPSVTNTAVFGVNDASANDAILVTINRTANTDMQFVFANTFTGALTATNSINTFHSILGTCTTTTAQNLYFDGKFDSTAAITASFTATAYSAQFNGDQVGSALGNGVAGWVYYGALWNRTITSPEARKLHDDPWCFLIYPEDEMFATLVGVTAVATSEDRWHQPWSSVGRRVAIIAAG